MQCERCRKNADGPQTIRYTFRGVKMRGHKPKNGCSACVLKTLKAALTCLIKRGYFSIAKGVVTVNWEKVRQCQIDCNRSGDTDDLALLGCLVKLNVLSYDTDDHYMIQENGFQRIFHIAGKELYFTKLQDAKNFIASLKSHNEFKILWLWDQDE